MRMIYSKKVKVMKALLLSDTHIMATRPSGRVDDFIVAQLAKWGYIIDTAIQERVDCIIQAGDLFNTPTPSFSIISAMIRVFRKFDNPIYVIAGQHDMSMRSENLDRTALGVLELAGVITILNNTGICLEDENVCLYGHSFGSDYTELKNNVKKLHKKDDSIFKLLAVHDMIGNKELYPGQELTDAKRFLKVWKEFNVILCGDYHYPYNIEYNGRYIINTGCLLRLQRTKRDMKRKLHFYILDTTDDEILKRIDIPCSPYKSTFDLSDKITYTVNENLVALDTLIANLKNKEFGVNIMDNLKNIFSTEFVTDEVRDLILEVLDVK